MKPLRPTRSLYEPLADINVTPFVDVMLVLLIVFMITAPMLAAGMHVELPRASAAQPLDPKEPVVITVRKDGTLYLGDAPVARNQVAQAVMTKFGDDRTRPIHLRGDREVPYGDMVALMDQLAANGFVKVALLANSQSENPAEKPLGSN
jgi:biopolymer transport protein TolR